jgi:hypothetical protein
MKRMRWKFFSFVWGWAVEKRGEKRAEDGRGKGLNEASEGDVTLLPSLLSLLFGFLCKVTEVNPFHYAVNVVSK